MFAQQKGPKSPNVHKVNNSNIPASAAESIKLRPHPDIPTIRIAALVDGLPVPLAEALDELFEVSAAMILDCGRATVFTTCCTSMLPEPIMTWTATEGTPSTTTKNRHGPGGKMAALGGMGLTCRVAEPSGLPV